MNLIHVKKLENILLSSWATFLDKTQLLKITLEHTRSINFRKLPQDEIPKITLKIQITKFELREDHFLLWIEFSTPKDNGVVVGEHEAKLSFSGGLEIINTNGTHFIPH